MIRRGKVILLKDVLTLIKTKKQASITEIITETNISSTIAYEIVELLTKAGLIDAEAIKQNRLKYKINENGKKALRAIKRLETIITPMGIAYLGDNPPKKRKNNADMT
ncbi:MAG: winged helix-turn-helix domain-containing protein [Candidatus Bathyarchaeia archaeon]|jgi:predicted transcriptional regulator